MRRMAVLFLALVSVASPSHAVIGAFDGIEMATVSVNGEDVTFPLGNTERKQDAYYLKKAVKGDQEALEIFLGGQDERHFYIGLESPRWLIVRKDSTMEIVTP